MFNIGTLSSSRWVINPSSGMEVDWALVQRLISDFKPKKYVEKAGGYKIFSHCFEQAIGSEVYEILDGDVNYSTKINLTSTARELIVLAPPALIPKPAKTKRRKATHAGTLPDDQEFILRIPVSDEVVDDFLLFRDCSRINIGLTEEIGPFLSISPGKISLKLGLHLGTTCSGGISENAMGQNVTVARLFARVLDMPQLLLPADPENDLKNMFEALTSPKTEFSNATIEVPGVITPLQKFQCRTVRWCLSREGCQVVDGTIQSIAMAESPFNGWYKVSDWWVNPFSAQIQPEEPEPIRIPYGGLLAEEMGLGKTLEVISLIKLHPRLDKGTTVNDNTGQVISKIGATLVIVPSGIIEQWAAELEGHSPSVKIIQYSGKGTVSPEDLAGADVVLASYATIASEIYSAQFNPSQRNTRFWKEREDINSVRSSLVQVQFWRVVLDEVQMLHGGVNNAARVAGLVPRVNGWAVTGTPVKNSMHDLRGQLSFLKVPHFSEKRIFERLLTVPDDFKTLISEIGIRHTKHLLRDELILPPQSRRLIMLEFNDMERLFYESVREEHSDPNDQSNNVLRNLLVKLRQACCITSTSGQSVFNDPNGSTLTVEQALQQLVFESETRRTRLLRTKISLFIDLAQLYLCETGFENKLPAISLCEEQIDTLNSLIEKSALSKQATIDKKKELDEEIESEQATVKQMAHDLEVLGQKIAGFGLDTAAEGTNLYEVVDVNSNPEFSRKRYEIIDRETALEDLNIKSHHYGAIIKTELSNIHSCKELQHRAYFFAGTASFRLSQQTDICDEVKAKLSAQEVDYYQKADDMLSEILSEQKNEFMSVRDKLKEPLLFEFENCDNIYEIFFNEQAIFMKDVYHQLAEILQGGLLEADQSNEEIYATTLDVQAQCEVLLSALQEMLALREKILEGTRDVKSSRKTTKRFKTETDGNEVAPSKSLKETLDKRISEIRKPIDTYELSEKKRVERANEARFKKMERDYRRKELTANTDLKSGDMGLEKVKAIDYGNKDTLKKECRLWRREYKVLLSVFNARAAYFKSLQVISDRVRDPEISDVSNAITRKHGAIDQVDGDIRNADSRLKFIAQLEMQMPGEREDNTVVKAEDECIICQETYIHGSFTTCGHRACKNCLQNWLAQKPTCPLCKTSLTPQDVFQFRFGDDTTGVQEANPGRGAHNSDQKRKDGLGNDVYEHISTAKFNQIIRQPLKKTYGVKIDTIVRHILLLKQENPTVQVVIFTQWTSMLQALTHALLQHGIRAMRKTQRNSVTQFRTDTDITCFMLHTSNDSAGLTLTNATHVILCEPLLTTAVELQAISRIHRIGQVQPTTVWLFAIQDTVEQQILALATERRINLARQNHQSEEVFESEIVTSTVGNLVDRSSGSEIVVMADMRRILEIQSG